MNKVLTILSAIIFLLLVYLKFFTSQLDESTKISETKTSIKIELPKASPNSELNEAASTKSEVTKKEEPISHVEQPVDSVASEVLLESLGGSESEGSSESGTEPVIDSISNKIANKSVSDNETEVVMERWTKATRVKDFPALINSVWSAEFVDVFRHRQFT